ncbi:MAG: hypothetical protein VB959_07500 [Rhodospirillales bacterium]
MDELPEGDSWAHGIDIDGYCDFGGKPAFKLAIQEVLGRWYLYVAHLWHQGWTITDVTDPGNAREVRYLEGPANTWTIQLQVAGGKMITGLERIAPGWGGDADAPFAEGIWIWDVSDPEDPKRLGEYSTGGTGTHRNYYDGGRYVHLTAGLPGYKGNIYVIVDLDDPANPTEVSRWWVPGQHEDDGVGDPPAHTSLHGGAYVVGNRAYLPYGGSGVIILDISDVTAPQLVSRFSVSPPYVSLFGIHTAVPIPGRGLIAANSEAIAENCDEPLCFAGLIDIADETAPRLVSTLPLPVPPTGAPYKNFCEFGGRFGPHNQHQGQGHANLMDDDNLLYMTYFNAGLRIFDISDAYLPKEIAFFVPPVPAERRGLLPKTMTPQSEDVVVDARGYIYISDKNHGVYILHRND